MNENVFRGRNKKGRREMMEKGGKGEARKRRDVWVSMYTNGKSASAV